MSVSKDQIRQAYRSLYKSSLHAVQYSKPARFILRDRLRTTFRTSPPEAFDGERISRTLEFMKGAAQSSGLEHRILKNLVHVWWSRQSLLRRNFMRAEESENQQKVNAEVDKTIEMLNESMGLCIK